MQANYKDEIVNGIKVVSRINGSHAMKRYVYRVTWDDESGNECGEDGYGFTSFDKCEQAMADAFKRAMENGRIGGKPVKFNGFPVMIS